jgi:hypothetical protein
MVFLQLLLLPIENSGFKENTFLKIDSRSQISALYAPLREKSFPLKHLFFLALPCLNRSSLR